MNIIHRESCSSCLLCTGGRKETKAESARQKERRCDQAASEPFPDDGSKQHGAGSMEDAMMDGSMIRTKGERADWFEAVL